MALTLEARPLPLQEWDDGSIRVGGTRVPLETVLALFNAHTAPEEIARRFDALRLADVYAVVAYYLDHKAEVDAYLEQREREAKRVRIERESIVLDYSDLRERLLTRSTSTRPRGTAED